MSTPEKKPAAAAPLSCAIDPSSRLILSMQAQGLSDALRFALQAGQKPGALTLKLYNQLRSDAAGCANGEAIARLPVADTGIDPVDLLSAVEVLRSTLAACLTPEEHDTRERVIGFSGGRPQEAIARP
jgi:hypothetical protein